ncbi:hypothetical protein BDV19DRAFT_192742 [Aspergillus venezuelensis]
MQGITARVVNNPLLIQDVRSLATQSVADELWVEDEPEVNPCRRKEAHLTAPDSGLLHTPRAFLSFEVNSQEETQISASSLSLRLATVLANPPLPNLGSAGTRLPIKRLCPLALTIAFILLSTANTAEPSSPGSPLWTETSIETRMAKLN